MQRGKERKKGGEEIIVKGKGRRGPERRQEESGGRRGEKGKDWMRGERRGCSTDMGVFKDEDETIWTACR